MTKAKTVARLKLGRLPDRAPVKMTLSLSPTVHADLSAYAELYKEVHGVEESLGVLIPHMLKSFLSSDRDFARWRKINQKQFGDDEK